MRPLEALGANHELTSLLIGWQWHAVRAAREHGASWQQIAHALDTTAEQARSDFLTCIEDADTHGFTDTTAYRAIAGADPATAEGR
ncbi:MAG: hypothetical protein ACREX8_01520 [Gammaproteobacteria bacterium]